MLKIVDIRATPISIPLLEPFKAAFGTRYGADFVILEIEDNKGRIGIGEASTIPIYAEGSQADVVYMSNIHLKPLLLGRDPRNINENMSLADKVMKGARALKSALDFALHDLVGKIYGLSVCQLLGGTARPVRVCWVLSSKDVNDIRVEAANKLKDGYSAFKLKVGIEHNTDLENLKALREIVGDFEIRLDANEAWHPKEALKMINEFIPYQPAQIEQPVPAKDLEGLYYITKNCKIPVSADEAAPTVKESMFLAKMRAVDRINIKLSRCGGCIEGRRIMAVAEAASLQPFFGSMLELGVGTAAVAHFVAAFADSDMIPTELIGPLLLKKDILKYPLIYKDGYLHLPEGPGLGVELDRDVLKDFMVK